MASTATCPQPPPQPSANRLANHQPTVSTATNQQEDKALESELLADGKEIAEHVMLVDLGRNDVGKVNQGSSSTR